MARKLEPLSPPELGLRELRRLREAGALPPAASRIAELQENMATLLLDTGYFARAMAEAPSEWAKRLFARHLALTLFEGLGDLAKLLPATTQEFARSRTEEATNARERLRSLSKSLSMLRRKYAADLEPVRHAAAAHRDNNMATFHAAVDALDFGSLARAALDLNTWTARASATVMALLFRYSKVQPELAEQLEGIADGIVQRG
jgi:hypothetical protein